MGVQPAVDGSRKDRPMPSSSARTCPPAVKSNPEADVSAVPSHQPAHAGRQCDGIDVVSAPSTQTAP